ncbi:MAG: transglycosylase domain-containing protein, partial [Chloroflexota bacterium]
TIAVEDDTFYENEGADIPSLLAALIYNWRNPDERPVGGSTITQQIVRHLAFDYEERTSVSYNRKAKEIILAWIMTREYEKDQILEMYLNEIYYGNLAYGVEAASQAYYGKSIDELNLAESTLLAGLPQSPVELNPLVNFQMAKDRQWIVLNLMVSEGFLNADEINEIYQEQIEFASQEVSLNAPHFATYVRQQLELQYGSEELANSGFQVTTSLDLNMQLTAEELARKHVNELRNVHNLNNASLVAIKPQTGEVLAMVGSVDYRDESIDGEVNVAISLQQPGSSIKPITYAAAMLPDQSGIPRWQPGDIVWDVETEYAQTDGQTYTPVNYDSRYHGPIRLRSALANSYNVPAVLLLQDIGVPRFLQVAQQLGISSLGDDPSRFGLSLTLGAGEVTPLELTSAYSVFANQGRRMPPVTILKIEKTDGEVVYEYTPEIGEQVIDPKVAFLINDILADDVARVPAMGRDNPLDLPFTAAAKTGTTNDFRDNWTVGYTPGIAVGVWAGNTDNTPMVDASGLTGAAPLWQDFMQTVYNDFELRAMLEVDGAPPPSEFALPAGLEKQNICSLGSIVIGASECQIAGQEWFLPEPKQNTLANQGTGDIQIVSYVEVEPSVVQATAVELPAVSAETLIALAEGDNEGMPLMEMCHFPEGMAIAELPPAAAPQIFLQPPRNEQSRINAYRWAFDNRIAILPTEQCNEDLLALTDPEGVIQRILSPKPNEAVNGVFPIIGTADFDKQKASFYKVELGVPQSDGNIQWVTLGDTHSDPVSNNTLEVLYSDGLTPGTYYLRLIVILRDGNYAGEPELVPFVIE